MNPGKLVDARPLDADLRYGLSYRVSPLATPRPGGFAFGDDRGSLQAAAERCVGVGRCRRDDTNVMCPSFRGTRYEEHSTRGRAKLLAEMFQGEATPETWRKRGRPGGARPVPVVQGLRGRLSRRAWTSRPTRRSSSTTTIGAACDRAPPISSGSSRSRRGCATAHPRRDQRRSSGRPVWVTVARKVGGITTKRPLPRFESPSFRRSQRGAGPRTSRPAGRHRRGLAGHLHRCLRPGARRLTSSRCSRRRANGWPIPSGWGCCGRPLYDSGMLGLARRWLTQLVDVLDPWTSRGIPVVVPEPSLPRRLPR